MTASGPDARLYIAYVLGGIGLALLWWAFGLYPRLRRHTAGVRVIA